MSARAKVKRWRATRKIRRANDLEMRRLARIEAGCSDATADRLERRATRLFEQAMRLDAQADAIEADDTSEN